MNDPERSNIANELRQVRQAVEELTELMTGNGSPERGIIVRMDRLEQTEKGRAKAMGIIGTVSIVAAVKAFWATIMGTH